MDQFTEYRRCSRRRVLKEGKIIIRPPDGTIEVIIRSLSFAGAKLEIPSSVKLPEKFELIVVTDATVTPAEVMWRMGNFVGVHFCGDTKTISLREY